MRLESAQGLKQHLLKEVVEPFVILASRLRGRGKSDGASAAKAGGLAGGPIAFGVSARPLDTVPKIPRSIALGVARREGEYKLAVRVQRPSLLESPLVEHLTRQAKGEVDVRVVGRIDKRVSAARADASSILASALVIPWYQRNTRPLSIGASVGHVDVTAGTIGAFVSRARATYLLSNNHVLANEDQARAGDRILQRANTTADGSRPSVSRDCGSGSG